MIKKKPSNPLKHPTTTITKEWIYECCPPYKATLLHTIEYKEPQPDDPANPITDSFLIESLLSECVFLSLIHISEPTRH